MAFELLINVSGKVVPGAPSDGMMVGIKPSGIWLSPAEYAAWIATPGGEPASVATLHEFTERQLRRYIRMTRVAVSASTDEQIAEQVFGPGYDVRQLEQIHERRLRLQTRHVTNVVEGYDSNWSDQELRTHGVIHCEISLARYLALEGRLVPVTNPLGNDPADKFREYRVPYETLVGPAMIARLRDVTDRVNVNRGVTFTFGTDIEIERA